jgi:arylsulfatase A-like enzyme
MGAKHIVCIIIDTWRLDYLGLMAQRGWSVGIPGKGVRTPNIDRFAQHCHVFERFVCGSHPCGPFRRDVWTGRQEFPFRGWGPVLESDRTHARELRQAGFVTFYLTSNTPLVDSSFWFDRGDTIPIKGNYHVFFDGWESIRGVVWDNASTEPIPETLERQYEQRFKQKPLNPLLKAYLRQRQHWRSEEDWPTARLFRHAADWIYRNRSHGRTFLMIDCFAPHEMFDPPVHYPALFRAEDGTAHFPHPTYGRAESQYSPTEMDVIRADYAGDLAMVDRWLGVLLDQIEVMGGMDDTLIVLTSDHGYYLGDNGFIGKPCAWGQVVPLHGCIARAPLIVFDPAAKLKSTRWHRSLVQGIDIYSTLLDFAGVALPEGVMGKSILPVLRESVAAAREVGLCGTHSGLVQVTDGRHMLIPALKEPPADTPELYRRTLLYDLETGLDDREDLSSERPEVVKELRRLGTASLKQIGAPDRFINRVAE